MSNLKGNLQSISLTDVLQLLHVNKKAGLLQVNGDKATGVLYISNGEVIHAETRTTKGEAAAFDILEWEKGEFEFLASKVPAQPSLFANEPVSPASKIARKVQTVSSVKKLWSGEESPPPPPLPNRT